MWIIIHSAVMINSQKFTLALYLGKNKAFCFGEFFFFFPEIKSYIFLSGNALE